MIFQRSNAVVGDGTPASELSIGLISQLLTTIVIVVYFRAGIRYVVVLYYANGCDIDINLFSYTHHHTTPRQKHIQSAVPAALN